MPPKVLTVDLRGDIREACSWALDREVHNLRQRLDLLWQQLYNRCCAQQEEMRA